MSITVRELNQYFVNLWMKSSTDLPNLGQVYTAVDKDWNEKQLLQFMDQLEQSITHPPRSREEVQELKDRLSPAITHLAEECLGFGTGLLDMFPAEDFSKVSEQFVRQARAFDPSLSAEDIYQAGRNAWTANGLQWLLGMPVRMTPSILAYSLLYPYSDNYLDDPEIGVSGKLVFNERFRQRLEGEFVSAENPHEQVIFDLVAMIEGQYPRSHHPEVFESLLAIHHAQGESLRLLHYSAGPGEVDVLGLSFEKGGTSVLADGYLVNPSINVAQRQYAYGHGIFAQLLDDMEDISQDSRSGRLTIYSLSAGQEPLDGLASRTFQFGHNVLMGLDCFEEGESVRELIQRAGDLFLIDTIGRMDQHYSEAFLDNIEAFSPFRFSFLREQRNNFFKRHGSLVQRLETVMF